MLPSLIILLICTVGLFIVARKVPFNRKNIEFCILVFMAALILTACYFVYDVAKLMGV